MTTPLPESVVWDRARVLNERPASTFGSPASRTWRKPLRRFGSWAAGFRAKAACLMLAFLVAVGASVVSASPRECDPPPPGHTGSRFECCGILDTKHFETLMLVRGYARAHVHDRVVEVASALSRKNWGLTAEPPWKMRWEGRTTGRATSRRRCSIPATPRIRGDFHPAGERGFGDVLPPSAPSSAGTTRRRCTASGGGRITRPRG